MATGRVFNPMFGGMKQNKTRTIRAIEDMQMKRTMMKARPLALLALLAALAACGTIDGVGRDISSASNRVSQML